MGQAWCLNTHGQRTLSSLGVSLHAICRSTRLSQLLCLCSSPHLGRLLLAGPGAQPSLLSLLLGHTEAAERNRVWRKRKERVSSFQGALLKEQRRWSTDGPLQHSKALLWEGRAGRQHCMCCKGHIHGNKEREASDPSRASRAVCSFPFVCSFRLKRLSRFTQVSALKKWAN